MKSIYKFIVAPMFAGLLFPGCIDDLDTLPLSTNILVSEKAWQQESTYTQFLAKIYAGFSISGNNGPSGNCDIVGNDEGETTFIRSWWNLQELPTDEVKIAWSDEGLSGLQFDQFTSDNRFCKLAFDRMYVSIAFCNEFLIQTTDDKLASRSMSSISDMVNGYRFEVRAARAINYYYLLDLFGNIPFVDENTGIGAYYPEQKDRKFMFSWIESELLACDGFLPERSADNYGKITNPVVEMMLAKLYLNAEVYCGQNRYDDCIKYLDKVIAAGYSIDPYYKRMFEADNNESPEIIFPVCFDGKNATTYGGITYLMAAAYGSDMDPATNFGMAQSWSGTRACEDLPKYFTDGDSRALFYTDKRTLENTAWNDYYQGYAVVKFTNLRLDGAATSDNLFPDTDFPLMRLADAYLMYAEAVLRGGNGNRNSAINYVNEIRKRAGVDLISDSQLTLDFILDERARELYWEGCRRTDLIRFGYFTKGKKWAWKGGVYSGVENIDSKYTLFPLPSDELSANPGIKQNEGY